METVRAAVQKDDASQSSKAPLSGPLALSARPRLSIVTPCYNEEKNVRALYEQVRGVLASVPGYTYEHIFIDNASRDGTAAILTELAAQDSRVKVILNTRNFGHLRSPYYALLQSSGEASVLLAADLQDPPGMIADFIRQWEQGYKVVLGVKNESDESRLMYFVRSLYYGFIGRVADVELTKHTTGFGLYDHTVIEILRGIDDPYPYFRGLISELGFEAAKITFRQPARRRGITSHNFYSLYDFAMLGITSHSKVPLRVATMLGFAASLVSLMVAAGYFVAKLIFWDRFSLGMAPLIIGLFTFSSVQLFFIGIVGEYIGFIYTHTLKRPLVVEKKRINF